MGPVSDNRITVYTDGACSGNPGPGGWAWIVPDGPFGAGPDAATTNQRMELQAVLDGELRGFIEAYLRHRAGNQQQGRKNSKNSKNK